MKTTQNGIGKISLLLTLALLVALIIAVVLVPLPQLITYKRADLISTSVYWRGFGDSGQLLDTQASFVKIDYPTSALHICQQYGQQQRNCLEYRIIEQNGPFHALWFLLSR